MKKIIATIVTSLLFLYVFAATTANQELANAKKLLFETARILESQNNMVVVDEIYQYDWYWVNDPTLTTPYINEFKKTIKDNKSIDQKRERLQYIYEQNKASTVSSLIPNALHIVNMTMASKNPLQAIIAVSGAALSSISGYVTANQKADLELMQQQWELDEQQVNIFEELSENLRSYLSNVCDKFGFTNEQLASIETLKSLISVCNQYDYQNKDQADDLLLKIDTEKFRSELNMFPEFWEALAKAAYGSGQYSLCLEYVNEYESRYVQTMYHDKNYALMMQIKAYCIESEWPDTAEKLIEIKRIADEICRMSPTSDWTSQYFCVLIYQETYERTGNVDAMAKAIQLMQEVVNKVADEYEKNLKDFMDGSFLSLTLKGIDSSISNLKENNKNLESTNKNKNTGKTAKSDNKKVIKENNAEIKRLTENKKTAKERELKILPPNSTLLYSMTKQFIDMCESVKYDSPKNTALLNKCERLLADDYSKETLFGSDSSQKTVSITYNYRKFLIINPADVLTITIPASYFTFVNEELDPEKDLVKLFIDDFEYDLADYKYEVKRGDDKKLESMSIIITFKISETVETGLNYPEGQVPLFKVKIESPNMQYEEAFLARVDKPLDLMKTFKNE